MARLYEFSTQPCLTALSEGLPGRVPSLASPTFELTRTEERF